MVSLLYEHVDVELASVLSEKKLHNSVLYMGTSLYFGVAVRNPLYLESGQVADLAEPQIGQVVLHTNALVVQPEH